MNVELGGGIEGLWSLDSGSVDLLLSDLPSGETQAKFDKRADPAWLWPAVVHALRPYGSVVFMASSLRYASDLIDRRPGGAPNYLYDLVWHKSIATGFLNVKRRPLRAHEFVLVFGSPQSVYNIEMQEGASPIHAARRQGHGETNYGKSTGKTNARAGATSRYPTSVLEFGCVGTSSKERVHPQQKPVPLLRWLIRTYSRPGDLVVDPFAGSGSTGVAAEAEGRRFRGWDSDPRFGGTKA